MADKQVKDINWVFSQIEKNDVKFIKVWFSDILGMLKSFTIPVQELKAGFEEGVGFDGSSVEGFTRIDESDMLAWPDPTTFSVLPWRPKENAVARMFADIRNPDGTPFDGDPRYILKKTLERAKKLSKEPSVNSDMLRTLLEAYSTMAYSAVPHLPLELAVIDITSR